jgi:hypothetical protein
MCDTCNSGVDESQLPIESELEYQALVLQLMSAGSLVDPESISQLQEAITFVLGERHWLKAMTHKFLFDFYSAMYSGAGDSSLEFVDAGISAGESYLEWSEQYLFPWYETHAAKFAIELVNLMAQRDSAAGKLRVSAMAGKYIPILSKIYGEQHEAVGELRLLRDATISS